VLGVTKSPCSLEANIAIKELIDKFTQTQNSICLLLASAKPAFYSRTLPQNQFMLHINMINILNLKDFLYGWLIAVPLAQKVDFGLQKITSSPTFPKNHFYIYGGSTISTPNGNHFFVFKQLKHGKYSCSGLLVFGEIQGYPL